MNLYFMIYHYCLDISVKFLNFIYLATFLIYIVNFKDNFLNCWLVNIIIVFSDYIKTVLHNLAFSIIKGYLQYNYLLKLVINISNLLSVL